MKEWRFGHVSVEYNANPMSIDLVVFIDSAKRIELLRVTLDDANPTAKTEFKQELQSIGGTLVREGRLELNRDSHGWLAINGEFSYLVGSQNSPRKQGTSSISELLFIWT